MSLALNHGVAQSIGELRGGEVVCSPTKPLELIHPANEGASIGAIGRGLQTPPATVGVEQQPCAGGQLSERVDGAEGCALA